MQDWNLVMTICINYKCSNVQKQTGTCARVGKIVLAPFFVQWEHKFLVSFALYCIICFYIILLARWFCPILEKLLDLEYPNLSCFWARLELWDTPEQERFSSEGTVLLLDTGLCLLGKKHGKKNKTVLWSPLLIAFQIIFLFLVFIFRCYMAHAQDISKGKLSFLRRQIFSGFCFAYGMNCRNWGFFPFFFSFLEYIQLIKTTQNTEYKTLPIKHKPYWNETQLHSFLGRRCQNNIWYALLESTYILWWCVCLEPSALVLGLTSYHMFLACHLSDNPIKKWDLEHIIMYQPGSFPSLLPFLSVSFQECLAHGPVWWSDPTEIYSTITLHSYKFPEDLLSGRWQ